MLKVKVSLFASAIRPHLWEKFLDSLKGGKYKYEVIFSGFIDQSLYKPFLEKYQEFQYIQTENIKPTQNYFIASKKCEGELIGWTADDAIYSEGYIDKIYEYWKSFNNQKLIISCKTNENENNETMFNHRFFGRNQNTPIMAPLGIMNREYFWKLGGYDKRYISGQAENDLCMRVYADGGEVKIYEDVCINIDHKNKHGSDNNFWSGYNEDREQLENSWVIGGYKPNPEQILVIKGVTPPYWYIPINNTEVTLKRNDKFVPYEDKDLLKVSQPPCGQWVNKWGT